MITSVRLSEEGLRILECYIENPSLPAPEPFDELRRHGLEMLDLQRTTYGADYFLYDHLATHFDLWALGIRSEERQTTYDEDIASVTGLHSTLAALILSHLKSPTRILDVGCGTGQLGLHFIRAGHPVDGIDISTEMMKYAQNRGYNSTELHNIATNPYRPETTYDCVISFGIFGDYVPAEKGLEHCLTALKEKAILGFSVEKHWRNIQATHQLLKSRGFIIAAEEEHRIEESDTLASADYCFLVAVR